MTFEEYNLVFDSNWKTICMHSSSTHPRWAALQYLSLNSNYVRLIEPSVHADNDFYIVIKYLDGAEMPMSKHMIFNGRGDLLSLSYAKSSQDRINNLQGTPHFEYIKYFLVTI